ncbi:MAG TPA: M24 family metallopeptidase [Chloroflexota bacterium]|nr:M24 family metallopeptidase [Chloroflexota bacterium]
MPPVDRAACLAVRRDAVRGILERHRLDAVVLRRFPNFAWYTDGGDNRVDHSSEVGVASVVVTRDADLILADSIEAERMRTEQTPGFEVVEYPWFEEPPYRSIAGDRLGADASLAGAADVSSSVQALRRVLDAAAVERYRVLGSDAEAACREAAGRLAPGMTEWEMMAALEGACRRRGLFSPVAMAAADGRIEWYRHPVTVGATAQRQVMLVVCAERGGLYANLTGWVHFDEPGDEWRRRQRACETILYRLRTEETRPGRTLAGVFQTIRSLYAEEGFDGEWRYHHQGGSTGYATRETVAKPAAGETIQTGNAFAWNPSISGAKAEETFVLSAAGPEVIARGFDGL